MPKKLNVFTKFVSVTLAIGLTASGCSKNASFSLLGASAAFQQNASAVNGKIDILFVIDNSGSMATSQNAIANNLASFFDKFDSKGFDYQIAVTTTEAYRVQFGAAASMAKLRDGTDATSHTGYFVVTPTTPNRVNAFKTNIIQGTAGNGDERAFSSFQAAMDSSQNANFGFPRADAFFSIIMVSDADDLSNTGAATIDTTATDTGPTAAPNNTMYTDPKIIPVQNYVSYLDTKFGVNSTADRASKYNVNAIGVPDQACINITNGGEKKIAVRMFQLADLTNGIKGSLCDDFGTTLSNISYKIIELRTRFYLNRQLNPASLKVFVNGIEVSRVTDSTPLPWNGFYYHTDDNSVSFHGTAVPAAGASISVSFDPTALQ